MIATRFEDPRQKAREETYALRRILVRRLQKATRGVSRRERVEQHQRFAEEWRIFSTDGRLAAVRQALASGEVPAWGGMESSESLLIRLAAGCRDNLDSQPQFTKEPENPGESGVPGLDSLWSEQGPRQAELFEPELIPYPA
jgi:hypothetical protein